MLLERPLEPRRPLAGAWCSGKGEAVIWGFLGEWPLLIEDWGEVQGEPEPMGVA